MQRRSFLVVGGFLAAECIAGEPTKAIALDINSYEDAVRFAKDSGGRAYVLFLGSRCEWCGRQKDVMKDIRVIGALKPFFVAYVNVSENKDVSRFHKVRVVPTHMILDQEGEVVKKFQGYQDAKEFLEWIG